MEPSGMMAAVTSSMRDRTGRTLEEWVEAVRTSGVDPLDQNEVRKWLKAEHGVPQNTQWAIAFEAATQAGWVEPTVEQYIDQQYSGPKAALRPIFDAARRLIEELGTDVRVEGRGTYTPFVRARQFAAIAAATKARVDLGLRFVVAPGSELLVPATAPGQSSHKIGLTSTEDVNDEVGSLIAIAYQQNGR
uniref:DUF5655 domain-containing protein n=1 Tax=Rhodococcus erythropolis TaxID=1833 RepID=UPI000BB3CFDB|nr:DUF5655 domain-containing protein [Rhodococcus erythropolis]